MVSLTTQGYNFVLALATLLILCSASQIEENDIDSFLKQLESSISNTEDNGQNEIKALDTKDKSGSWGIPDVIATVGKVFEYQLPAGDSLESLPIYKVTELGRSELPSWLDFDTANNILTGVAGPEHSGIQHYLEVSAINDDAQKYLSGVQDMFTIRVRDHQIHSNAIPVSMKDLEAKSDELKPIQCPVKSSVTRATIVVDVELGQMKPTEKVGLMKRMCDHLGMPNDLIRLAPVGNKPMFDSSALVAGPGDVKTPSTPGALLQWEVGCGNVHANHMPVLQTLESTSSNGSMSQAIGEGVIGWHVTNNKVHKPKRLKRQVWIQGTATPLPSAGPPTRQPVPTRVIPKEETDEPTDRVIVTMSSPVFTEDVTKTKDLINPTGVVDIRPTKVPDVTPEIPVKEPTKTPSILEPSMTPPLPAVTSTKTEILPTTTIDTPNIITTKPIKPTTTKDTTEPTKKPDEVIPPIDAFNYPPNIKNQIIRITVNVGEPLNYRIPKNTFVDYEDGNTRKLKLLLMNIEGMSLSPLSWIKLSDSSQHLYGLPLKQDIGTKEYTLVAVDSGGKVARDVFEMVVRDRPENQPINHEFSMTLDLEYKEFIYNIEKKLEVADKIAKVFGDKNSDHMTITSIEEGSVVYAWTNNSLPLDPCPTSEIAYLVSQLLTDNNTLNKNAVEKMKPYKILRAGAKRKGACLKDEKDSGKGIASNGEVSSEPHENDDIIVTLVIPIVIIATLLILAILIACILYRKRKQGKHTINEQPTFVKKGAPVIFADELEDDKPDAPTKPLIMADEKPPIPPPEYIPMNGGPSSPSTNHKEPLLGYSDNDDDPPYRPPPPPFTRKQEETSLNGTAYA